jgi:hypothetical protein
VEELLELEVERLHLLLRLLDGVADRARLGLLGGDVALGVGLLEVADLLGDGVDLRAGLVDALLELAGLFLEDDDAVDVGAAVLAEGVLFDLLRVLADEFHVEHGLRL